jgi:hypothetical protein
MEIRLEHPEVLSWFEAAPPPQTRLWGIALAGLWLFISVVDWSARFIVFRWQDQWAPTQTSPAPAGRTRGEATVRAVPAQTGADLSRMVPVPSVAARYAEFHPGYLQHADPWGYLNAPAPADGYYPVVMVGDSFMIALGTQHVAEALGSIGGIPVYNHGMFGAGPFHELEKFIASDRFEPPPLVVVWNLSARELGAPLFLRQPVDAWFDRIDVWAEYRQGTASAGIRWERLKPAELSRAWPNTSLVAYGSRRAWSQARLLVFREWPHDVRGGNDPVFGPMLFYGENLRLLSVYRAEIDAPAVVQTARKIATKFGERGITLVVLLVPEKEQIHVAALPPEYQVALAHGPELLLAIEKGLEAEGIPAVNLMPAFQNATAQGQRLYWRDDTHWNDAGIRLAAEELWLTVGPLLE